MKLILRNLTEDIVTSKLDALIERLGGCNCDICRLDVASYALNRLPNKYVATTQGELLSKIGLIDNDFTIRVTTELTKAISIIKSHPRHEIIQTESESAVTSKLPEFPDVDIETDEGILPPGAEAYFAPIDNV